MSAIEPILRIEHSFRVLMRCATPRDDLMTANELNRIGVEAVACRSLQHVREEMEYGVGALLLAEEALSDPNGPALMRQLGAQPPWSDLAMLVLARQGADSPVIARALLTGSNVTVLERPMRVAALVSAVQSSLRGRQRQYELRDMVESLRVADQRKTEFLATLAHELRNPLAPLSNCVGLLKRGLAAPAKVVPVMERQLHHMIRLVDDLLELSRITRGKVDLRMEDVELRRIVEAAIETSRPLIEKARHVLQVSLPTEPLWLRADPVRLAQVVSNLLNNAARYTDPGGEIQLVAHRDDGDAVLCIQDNGSGLSPEALEGVFDMFTQADAGDKRAQHGLGIGLALVRNLVEMHGGVVNASSEGLGLGSTFEVRLPLAHPAREQAPLPLEGELLPLPMRILVVDDNRDAAETLCHLLAGVGAQVEIAFSGPQALALLDAFDPQVAVLDLGMPGMSGLDVARQIRARPGNRCALVALTGWGQSADRELTRAAGFRHHLTKPVDFRELHALLVRLA